MMDDAVVATVFAVLLHIIFLINTTFVHRQCGSIFAGLVFSEMEGKGVPVLFDLKQKCSASMHGLHVAWNGLALRLAFWTHCSTFAKVALEVVVAVESTKQWFCA